MSKQFYSTELKPACWLYGLVFQSSPARLLTGCVLLTLLLQPVGVVFASEEEVTVAPEESVTVSEPVTTQEAVEMEELESTPIDGDSEPVEVVSEAFEAETTVDDGSAVAPAGDSDLDQAATSTLPLSTNDTGSTTATSSVLGFSTTTEAVIDEASNQTQIEDEQADTETSTSSEIAIPLTTTTRTNDNHFQFSKDDCVSVRDGSYYCGSQTKNSAVPNQFYVALDTDGDRELFVDRDGSTVQITHNRYDDAAPFYDSVSNTLVWHRQVEGRYQVVAYDFDSEEEQYITSGRSNSMEPSRYGDYTVWQQWTDDSWEIMLHDGSKTIQISTNEVPDIAPVIHETLVTWKRHFANEQVVVVYDTVQGKEVLIEETDQDTTVVNARLLLVFESVTAAGERVWQGFDPETKEIVPISTELPTLPENLPTSEPTPEVRALVQPKTQFEDDEVVVVTPTASSTPPATHATSSEVVATDTTLVIEPVTPATTTEAVQSPSAPENPEFDLTIPPLATSSATSSRYD